MKLINLTLIASLIVFSSCEKVSEKILGKVTQKADRAIVRQLVHETTENAVKRAERNLFKAGKRFHPKTGVEYLEKNIGGRLYKNIAVFPYKTEIKLPQSLWKASDQKQFLHCMEQLRAKVMAEPEWAKNTFNKKQLTQINNKKDYCINGYTWHHSENEGVMQLVENNLHARTPHTGGRTIWGGGNSRR